MNANLKGIMETWWVDFDVLFNYRWTPEMVKLNFSVSLS